jgi:hypothetical protein
VNKVPVAAFSAPIDKTRLVKLCDKFSHLLRHKSPFVILSHNAPISGTEARSAEVSV